VEAEAVVYVVGKYFCFSNNGSPNYFALYGADTKLIQYYLDRNQETATYFISRCGES
jgi:hypothetical protein